MMIRLSRIHYPVEVLGYGKRLGVWFQGCSNSCPGCISKDTWSRDAGFLIEIGQLIEECIRISGDIIDGITISGGEPFEQPLALQAFLEGIHEWRNTFSFDVLCYSGLSFDMISTKYPTILALMDAIIPEPYIESIPSYNPWAGSGNQPIIPLTDLGRDRYSLPPDDNKRAIQYCIDADKIWFIGIPRKSDMDRILFFSANNGLKMESVSWHS